MISLINNGSASEKDMCNIYETFNSSCEVKHQKELLKELIHQFSTDCKNENICKILTDIYLFTTLKHPIRRAIAKLFDETVCNKLTQNFWSRLLTEANLVTNNNIFADVKKLDNLINGLYAVLERKILDGFSIPEQIFIFLSNVIVELYLLLSRDKILPTPYVLPEQIYNYMQHFIRITLSISQVCSPPKNIADKLVNISFRICMLPIVTFETKANCAHMMLILFRSDSKNNFKGEDFINFLNCQVREYQNQEKDILETFYVCVKLAFLKVIPLNEIESCFSYDCSVVLKFLNELLISSKQFAGKPTQILGVTQAIVLISDNFHHLFPEDIKILLKDLLTFIFSNLDHYMNTIRSNTVDIFIRLLKVTKLYEQKDNDSFIINFIIDEVFKLSEVGNNFYKALSVLSKEISCSKIISKHPNIPVSLLNDLTKTDVGNEICECFKNLMTLYFHEQYRNDWLKKWVEILVDFLKTSPENCREFYHQLFVESFKLDQIVLKTLLDKKKGNDSDDLILVYLGCLCHLRKKGLPLSVPEIHDNESKLFKSLISFSTLEKLMFHRNDTVRVSVLALVVDSHKTTEIFSKWDFNFLVSYFEENTSVLSPNTRQQIVALGKKMFNRYNESIKVLLRNKNQIEKKLSQSTALQEHLYEVDECLSHYETFWCDLFARDLSLGLHPGANFSRRCSCLQLLLLASEVIQNDQVWTQECIQHLKDVVQFDTYESNKEKAVLLSRKLGVNKIGLNDEENVKMYFTIIEKYLISVKTSETLSASYMLEVMLESPHAAEVMKESAKLNLKNDDKVYVAMVFILNEINQCIELAKTDLRLAAQTKPLHGLYLALRHLVKILNVKETCKDIVDKIIDSCFEVLPIIFQVICNSSPEGYVITEEECVDVDETSSAQLLLVYTWRAAKETSLLLGEIISKLDDVGHPVNGDLVTKDKIEKIGDFFMEFLMTVKHRGAFEQGYIGFTNYCQRLWSLYDEKLKLLPQTWLKMILDSLKNNIEYINACSTRRSAGLPFLIQAIIITEPKTEGNLMFHHTMKTLLTLCENCDVESGVVEPVIHSLNILKALYRHNQLGENVTPYISQGVIVAIKRLNNKHWSVRNSATLLFVALMTRMFGVQRNKKDISSKNKLSAHVFFTRYPLLYEFLLQELQKGTHEGNSSSLYAVLLIFGRIYPGKRNEDSKYKLSPFLFNMESCLSSKVLQTRDLAAAASVSVVPYSEKSSYINGILKKFCTTTQENHKHGLTLQLLYLLKDVSKDEIDSLDVSLLAENMKKCRSNLTKSECVKIVTQIVQISPKSDFCVQAIKNILYFERRDDKYVLEKYYLVLLHVIFGYSDDKTRSVALCKRMFELITFHEDDKELSKIFVLKFINSFQHSMGKTVDLFLTKELDTEGLEWQITDLLSPLTKVNMEQCLKKVGKVYLLYLFPYICESKSTSFLTSYFIALRDYVQVLGLIFDAPSEAVNFLVTFCERVRNDYVTTAVISVVTHFFKTLDAKSKVQGHISKLVLFLDQCMSSECSIALKLSVCDFFLENRDLFYEKDSVLCGTDLVKTWFLVSQLVEDDEHLVRNRISRLEPEFNDNLPFAQRSIFLTAEVAKKKILQRALIVLPETCLLQYFLLLIFRGSENDEQQYNTSDVFDKGSINIHSELLLTSCRLEKLLKRFLWNNITVVTHLKRFEIVCKLVKTLREISVCQEFIFSAEDCTENDFLVYIDKIKHLKLKTFLKYIIE